MIILGGAGAGKTMFALTPNLLEIRDRNRKYILCYVLSGLSVLAAGTGAVLYLNRGNIIFEIVAFAGAAACAVLLRTAGRIEKANAIPRRRVSKVFTDSKGEILRENGNYCHTRGDKVLVFNLIEMEKSNGYNPFKYIRNENDVIKLVTNLITNTTPKDSTTNDPFWVSAESMLLMSIFYYVWLECDMEERKFESKLSNFDWRIRCPCKHGRLTLEEQIMDKKQVLPWWQKYTLTLNEASEYFGIGYKKLKMFVEGHSDEEFVLWNGNRALIKREQFERYIDNQMKVI